MTSKQTAGCNVCLDPKSFIGKNPLNLAAELHYSDHYDLSILTCPNCDTRFLCRFFEDIDIGGGDDLMFSSLTPLYQGEAEYLEALFANPSTRDTGMADAEALFCSRPGLMQRPDDKEFSWMSEGEVQSWQRISEELGVGARGWDG